jgi:hypothetical protein
MRYRLVLLALLVLIPKLVMAQGGSAGGWVSVDSGFRPVAITTNGETFWACGSNESIASSPDGRIWQVKHHHVSDGGALLLGMEFASDRFGYAYGSGGAFLTTTDGGETWNSEKIGTENILRASFVDATHGILRTTSSLLYRAGGEAQPVPMPSEVPSDFHDSPSLAAISRDRMSAVISEGWRSRAGFVSTTDGGKSWTFYEPPHIVTYDFLRAGGSYWAIGTETVGYDQPGGGLGVPLVMSSSDARTWQHTVADVKACHWEGCNVCKVSGCLASRSLLVNPFGAKSSYFSIPQGHLTAEWAATASKICSIDSLIYCTSPGVPGDILRGGEPQPEESGLPPLGTKPPTGLVRCISCSLVRLFVDSKMEGRFTVHFVLTLSADGTTKSIIIKDAPTESIRAKLQEQALAWLFEPPMKDGKAVGVNLNQSVAIQVVRSR